MLVLGRVLLPVNKHRLKGGSAPKSLVAQKQRRAEE